jgi:DNA polymerase-3 subunit epsilon
MNYSVFNEPVIVIDFETSGMTPENGDRAIEVAAVLVRDGQIKEHFQRLINPGFLISREIEMVTGINNQMLAEAESADQVLPELARFISSHPLVAHNASFDQKFLEAEFALLGKNRPFNFGCTLKISRRIYPDLQNYKLETLVRYHRLENGKQFHRALADAEMTAALWLKIISDLKAQYGLSDIPFDVLKKLSTVPYDGVTEFLNKTAAELKTAPPDTTGSLF